MAAAMAGQKHKLNAQGQSDEWTIRERLILASSVVRSGDQNWVSVSRSIKPIGEMGPSAKQRPPDFFSQKSCALHYAEMLEKVSTPKRKRTNESSGAALQAVSPDNPLLQKQTPGDQIVRKLTFDRIEELKKSVKQDHIMHRNLKTRIEDIRNGKFDAQLPGLWEKIQIKRRRNEESQSKPPAVPADSETPVPNTPTTPTTPITPSGPHSAMLKQGTPSAAATHQRGKQQRVPKPTPRFQKYQQQLQQQRQSHTTQHHPQGGQGIDGIMMEGDILKQDQMEDFQGAGGSTTQMGEQLDVEMGNMSQAGSYGADGMVHSMTRSPSRKGDEEPGQSPVKQLPPRRSSSVGGGQTPADAPVLSALLSAPPRDAKQNSDQDTSQKDGSSSSIATTLIQNPQSGSSQVSTTGSAQWINQGGQTLSSSPNTQTMEGKPFLGVTSSTMEGKKLDSIRERLSSGSSSTPGGAPASVAAPTLSKLLTTNTTASSKPGNSPPCNTVAKPSITVQPVSSPPSKEPSVLSVGGGGAIAVGGQEGSGVQAVTNISVNPKNALAATLPSSMAITPPPVTPPAEIKTPKRLIVNLQDLLVNQTLNASSENEHDSVTNVAVVKRDNDTTASAPIEHPAVIELKMEAADTPSPSPRIGTRGRAPKPGRPGRPSKAARKSQRRRTKSATSTDNETEVEEERDEDTKSESLDIESEKASEKTEDEEELDFPPGEKKGESDFDEQTSIDDGLSETGDRSQTERDDPTVSFRDLLAERGSIAGSESVPASPASQISQSDDHEAVQSQKTWKKSIMLVWRAAANHKYANVFNHPVTDDEAPGYHTVVFRPMDLSTIKKNIENGSIRTTSEFQRDMMLMFQNALMYNSADHDVYHMAEEMRDDVMDQIQSYIATQIMVQSSDRESKMLRGHKSDVFHFFL